MISKTTMTEAQFEFTAHIVRREIEPFLRLHFGERCETYEHNCECCQRWAALDRMLTTDSVNESLKKEIQTLESALEWRKELFQKLEGQTGNAYVQV